MRSLIGFFVVIAGLLACQPEPPSSVDQHSISATSIKNIMYTYIHYVTRSAIVSGNAIASYEWYHKAIAFN